MKFKLKELKILIGVCSMVVLSSGSVLASDRIEENYQHTYENNIILDDINSQQGILIEKERYHGESRADKSNGIFYNMPETYPVLERYTMFELSELLDLSIDEILEIQNDESYNFDETMILLLETRSFGQWDENASKVGITTIQRSMSGDIHLTPQGRSLGFQHGHAALAYDRFTNIETLGVGHLSKKLPNNGWGNYNSYRAYYVPSISSFNQQFVPRWAEANLLGRNYNALATVSMNNVNCSSLVWKAFNDSGVITLDHRTGVPFLPQALADARQTDWYVSYNWSY